MSSPQAELSSLSEGSGTRAFIAALRRGWMLLLAALIVGVAVAAGLSALETPKYQASALLYVTSGTDDNSQSAYQGSLASQQRVASYTKLVTSDAIIDEALRTSGLPISAASARAHVSASASTDTVLLTINVVDTDRGTAALLANSVAQAMTSYVARLETPSGGGQPLAKLTVVTPARVLEKPVAPRTTRNCLLGGLIGLIVGGGVLLLRAKLRDKILEVEDLPASELSPVLGHVPSDGSLRRNALLDFAAGNSLATEGFRKIRTNLTFANVDNPPKAILVTSAAAAEGKTTTAVNLAVCLAELGNRVLLLDADLRRPQVNTRMGLLGQVGFTSYLKGDNDLIDLIQETETERLSVLAAGPVPPNPAELLASKRAGDAVRELAASFDFVIVDSPPVLPVTDAVVLAQWVDGVVVVARSNRTRIKSFSDAIAQFSSDAARILGFVLTDTRASRDQYSYYAAKPTRGFRRPAREQKPGDTERPATPVYQPKH